jgi:type I restriction enzyme S subunit
MPLTTTIKSGYKQTEVGMIPEDWDARTIGNDIDLLTGFPFPSIGYSKAGIRLLRGSNVKRGQTDWEDDITQYWPAVTQDIARYSLKEGDLVIAMDGSLVGRSFAQLKAHDLPSLLLQRVARIRSTKLDVTYLTAFVGSDRFVKYADSVKTVTAIPHISPADIRNFTIPVPPTMEEQRAIAGVLSDVDALIASLDKVISKKRDIKTAAMQQLLTGKTRLPGFRGKWQETTLGEIGECVIGLTYKPENVVEHGLLVFRSSNVHDGRLAFEDKVHVNLVVQDKLITREGDILICVRNGSRALIGKCAMIDERGAGNTFGAFMSVYRTKYSSFIFHAFQSYDIQRQIRENIGATINQITNKDMKALRLKLPPEFEQKAITAFLSDMDEEIIALEKRRDKTRALKQGMMQNLLAGKTRLI